LGQADSAWQIERTRGEAQCFPRVAISPTRVGGTAPPRLGSSSLAFERMHSLRVGLAAFALLLPQQLSIPAPQGYVNDFAGVVPAASVQRIQRIIDDVRAKSGGEIVVVTLRDLAGRDKADVALQIGRQWGVGKKGNPGDVAR